MREHIIARNGCFSREKLQLSSGNEDALAFYAGVDRWRWLLEGARKPRALLDAVGEEERARVRLARADADGSVKVSSKVAFIVSDVWGFDVWYEEVAPVVVAWAPRLQNVTVGVRDLATAERLFGSGGLKNVFPTLQPVGWGGRESVGGSPRGLRMAREQALMAARVVSSCLINEGHG